MGDAAALRHLRGGAQAEAEARGPREEVGEGAEGGEGEGETFIAARISPLPRCPKKKVTRRKFERSVLTGKGDFCSPENFSLSTDPCSLRKWTSSPLPH